MQRSIVSHPKDKRPVGERLAFCELFKHYGKNVSYSGPTLALVKRLGMLELADY